MNKRQRDANRATARVARWILHGTRQSFGGTAGSGSMVILSSGDFIRGTTMRPTLVCYDDMEVPAALTLADLHVAIRNLLDGGYDGTPRTIPVLAEGEGDMLRALDGRWASAMNSLTGPTIPLSAEGRTDPLKNQIRKWASAVVEAPKQIEFVNVMLNPGWGTE